MRDRTTSVAGCMSVMYVYSSDYNSHWCITATMDEMNTVAAQFSSDEGRFDGIPSSVDEIAVQVAQQRNTSQSKATAVTLHSTEQSLGHARRTCSAAFIAHRLSTDC